MDSNSSPRDPRGRPLGCSLGDASAGPEVIGFLGRLSDLEAVERAAVALAVHPGGAGCERAWLFVWTACSELLEERWSAAVPVAAPALIEWLERQATRPLGLEPPGGRLSVRPQRLTGAVAQAWNPGALVPAAEPERGLPWMRAQHVGAVALRRSGLPWALLVGIWNEGPTPERQTALQAVAALCVQAAAAVEQSREAKWRARQVSSLAQVVRAAGSTLNLAEVLPQVVRLAAQATGSRGGALWLATAAGLRLEAAHGPIGRRERTAHSLLPLARVVVEEGKPRAVDRATEELLLAPEAAAEVGSVVICPLRAYGRVLGAVACYGRAAVHPSDPAGFPAGDVEFMSTLADLAGIALDQAGRFAESRQGEQERRELSKQLQRQERLAWLGELAARVAQEARNPLASIGAFARRVQRALAEDDPNRDYLEIILRESERLEGLLEEQSGFRLPEGALRLEDLNAVAQTALGEAADMLVRRRVRLVKKLAPGLPALLLDRERIRRVVGNMLQSALEAVGVGGRIRIESRGLGSCVVLEVAHDGPHTPGELLEQVFMPFASQRPGGTSVGLAVAQQIVREHGGEIRVRSDGEWSTVFSLSLPVHENQDRRRGGADRRCRQGDRRASRPHP